MATQEDRSLSSGMSLPQWMKNKLPDKFDFDQSTFSPTEIDGSFMYYYRTPAPVRTESSSQIITASGKMTVADTSSVDFSKHTPPCQKFLQNPEDVVPIQKDPLTMKIKPNGTDDGFKGEAAKCGSSIIKVAHQMVAEKVVTGYDSNQTSGCNTPVETYKSHRRGSKSLPASPLTSPHGSPKSTRRVNKYFTGAFVDADKSKGSWILSNLLAKRNTLSQSVGQIGEETTEELERTMSNFSVNEVPVPKNTQVFKAKPSELREMNFWSPTSM